MKQRERETVNKNIPTGEVELVIEELRLLNESKQPPFLPGEAVLPNEEMRLKYRYIDLRRGVDRKGAAKTHRHAAAAHAKLPGDRRQRQDGAHGVATVAVTLDTPAATDDGR